jgi:hypothetical protein
MGTFTHSAFPVNCSLSLRTLPRTILVYRDQIIHGHDELLADLIESSCNISRQFRTYHSRMVLVAHVQEVQRVFWLKELGNPYEYWLSGLAVHANVLRSLVR